MRQFRAEGIAAPILIVSALGEVDDRVRGLRAGGDDYLVKPFSFVELLARVEALGRRSDTIVKETILRVGDLALDLMSRTASRRGKDIALFPREFQLLEYLVRNEGRVVSRAMVAAVAATASRATATNPVIVRCLVIRTSCGPKAPQLWVTGTSRRFNGNATRIDGANPQTDNEAVPNSNR